MKFLQNIISVILSSGSNSDAINKIGTINKKIGSTYYIKPYSSECLAISATVINDKIVNIGITLIHNLSLSKFKEEINIVPFIGYNNYDEDYVYNFDMLTHKISIKIKDNQKNKTDTEVLFKELDIKF